MRTTLLVAGGGVAGAFVRLFMGEMIPRDASSFPVATLLANICGCLLIGLAARRLDRTSDSWAVAVTGFLGGLTTFSAFAVETGELVAAGNTTLAACYVFLSVGVGLAATEVARCGRRRQ